MWRSRVYVPLFLFVIVILQIISTPVFAQDLRNRTEEMYPFGTVIIAKESLPDRVYESQRNKILISVIYFEKGTSKTVMSSMGTGFISESPGIIITVRHLLSEDSPMYDRVFMGTIVTDSAWINFPLSLVAVGERGTFKDMMALRTDVATMEKARIIGDVINPNPYGILLKTSKFVDAKVDGKKIYISGFAPVVTDYPDKNNQPIPVYTDLINFTFLAEITASISNMPVNKADTKKLFRLIDSAEPGFSGGKVMNSQGEVVGMTLAVTFSKNFVYVISSKDIKQFLKDHKIK